MNELTINGVVYEFNFGMGFLREVNKKISVPVEGAPGVRKNIGLRYVVSSILDGDTEALVDVLDAANKECKPRLTRAEIDRFVDAEDTEIDEVFEKVVGFLRIANATKKTVVSILEAVEKEKMKMKAQMEQ